MSRRITLIAAVITFLTVSICFPWQLEKDVERRLAGAWALVSVEIYSNCSGAYNNNEVSEVGVSTKADRRFEPGELVRIDKINLKKQRLDLFVTLREPILISRADGPFELFDERSCKAQLMIDLPRSLTKEDDIEGILNRLDKLLRTAPSLQAAVDSPSWNQRTRAPYPEDYDLTLARHTVWVAEQMNAAVVARKAQAHRDIARLSDDIRTDKEYLAGFAAGIEDLRSWDEDDCSDLIDADLSWVGSSTPNESRTWKEGYEDGQGLIFNLFLIENLEYCLVPVPTAPQ